MRFSAEILLLSAEIFLFLGSVQKYYYPGTRGGWILVQGHFWGWCRNINFLDNNIHLCTKMGQNAQNLQAKNDRRNSGGTQTQGNQGKKEEKEEKEEKEKK